MVRVLVNRYDRMIEVIEMQAVDNPDYHKYIGRDIETNKYTHDYFKVVKEIFSEEESIKIIKNKKTEYNQFKDY